jgi:hypothetical protein
MSKLEELVKEYNELEKRQFEIHTAIWEVIHSRGVVEGKGKIHNPDNGDMFDLQLFGQIKQTLSENGLLLPMIYWLKYQEIYLNPEPEK